MHVLTAVMCSVRETRLPAEVETDFATVHTTHRALIDDARTLQLILLFLRHQNFGPESREVQTST